VTSPASWRRAFWPLAAWLAALAGCAAVIVHTRFTADLSAFLPASPDARQQALIEQLKSGLPARTLLLGIDGGTMAQRADASRALAARLRAGGLFEQVQNGERAALADIAQWVFERRYLLSPAIDARRFGSEGLREAIDDTLSLLGTPAGAAVKPLLDRDPTGETQRIAEQALGAGGPRSEGGVWASRDGARAVLMVQARAEGSDLDAQQAAIEQVRNSFSSVAAAGLTLRYSGTPRFAVESRAQIESEVRRLAIAGAVLMGGLLLIAFASLAALGTAMLPVATAVLAGITAVSLGFGTVHGVTLGFGTTLIGEAVDYAIYYLIQARSSVSSQPGWRDWLRTGWPTVRLGLLTSVCGFVALAFSGFPGLAQLGVFSIAGLVAAALTTRFVLPVLMPDGTHGVGLRRHLGRWAVRLVQRLPRARHCVTALGVLGVALLLWHRDHLWQADLSSLSPVSAEALALDASLRADLGADDSGVLVVVQAADVQTLLQRVEGVTALLDTWVQDGRLSGYDAVTRWMPSLDTQRRRQAALPDAAPLRTSLAQATRGGPLPAARLEPFVDAVQRSRSLELVTPESIRGSAVAPLVSNLLLRRADGGWTALLPLHAGATPPDEAVVQQAVHGIEGAQALNIGAELRRLYRHYLGEAQGQALLGALGVVVLIALWLRSPRRLLAVCQPLLIAVLLTMATLAALGVPMGILHLVGLLLVVAVGSNYALYFDLLRHQASFDADTLASLLLANATTVLSFGLIACSEIPALSAIGRVVAPGALLALLLAATYAAPANPPPPREAPV